MIGHGSYGSLSLNGSHMGHGSRHVVPPVDQFIAVMVHSFCVTRVIMGQTFVVNSLLNGMFTKRLMHWVISHWVMDQVSHG